MKYKYMLRRLYLALPSVSQHTRLVVEQIETDLNRAGAEGWELCGILNNAEAATNDCSSTQWFGVFKRPVQ